MKKVWIPLQNVQCFAFWIKISTSIILFFFFTKRFVPNRMNFDIPKKEILPSGKCVGCIKHFFYKLLDRLRRRLWLSGCLSSIVNTYPVEKINIEDQSTNIPTGINIYSLFGNQSFTISTSCSRKGVNKIHTVNTMNKIVLVTRSKAPEAFVIQNKLWRPPLR